MAWGGEKCNSLYHCGCITISWQQDCRLFLDSGFRRHDGSATLVMPGKAEGRDPESNILFCTLPLHRLREWSKDDNYSDCPW